ncbi:MarR family transcriptional regulator [Clostridium polyendosporum]|uniref:MarR family transcriptional regulator n=1 Tax=Clostridium polyendosporum TaxID=69208 RepID=A0A919RYH1_9CLOT|nr:MarR family transcriptional regulator [Clostridium polyendosporum]GIM27760.1 MarR family transcriptional regulator [Clostridium polyendosporum]
MKDGTDYIRTETLHMALIKVLRVHKRRANSEFCKIGMTQGQPKILDFLSESDGCIQRELAENCNIEPATVTSLLASMEKAGLIYRTQNSKDKRVLNVFLTDKGKVRQKEVEKVFNLMDEECFQGFSEEEKVQTMRILNKIYENMIRKERG